MRQARMKPADVWMEVSQVFSVATCDTGGAWPAWRGQPVRGICDVLELMYDRDVITIQIARWMRACVVKVVPVSAFGAYKWPLTMDGHEQRQQFCWAQAQRVDETCDKCKDWGATTNEKVAAVCCPQCSRPTWPNLGVNLPAGAATAVAAMTCVAMAATPYFGIRFEAGSAVMDALQGLESRVENILGAGAVPNECVQELRLIAEIHARELLATAHVLWSFDVQRMSGRVKPVTQSLFLAVELWLQVALRLSSSVFVEQKTQIDLELTSVGMRALFERWKERRA